MRVTVTLAIFFVGAVVVFAAGAALRPRLETWRAAIVAWIQQRWPEARARLRDIAARIEALLPSPKPGRAEAASADGAGGDSATPGSERSPGPMALALRSRPPVELVETIPFDPLVARGTRGVAYELHAEAWRTRMKAVGDRLRSADVGAVVFVHGTFTGHDPLSALRLVERKVPRGAELTRALRKATRATVSRVLGDLGTFGPPYVRLFEQALGGALPCTEFVWSSENHHVGRLEGAFSLVHALAMHASLADRRRPRLLVIGHSHAAQLFALVTQLLAGAMAREAFVDAARIRGLDTGSLDAELDVLACARLDFVTLGAPSRYAWARVSGVRALHVLAAPSQGTFLAGGDWIARLGTGASDFPALDPSDRRANAGLESALGPSSLSAGQLVSAVGALAAPPRPPAEGTFLLVDYGTTGVTGRLTSGFGHGAYTRLDAMLFHAELVAARLYPTESLIVKVS